jgi:hypothetical protein
MKMKHYPVHTVLQDTFFEMWEKILNIWEPQKTTKLNQKPSMREQAYMQHTQKKNPIGTKRLHDQWRGRSLCKYGGFEPTEPGS